VSGWTRNGLPYILLPLMKGEAFLIQIVMGDDEHTAAEGPYPRLLKCRKWLLLFGSLATLQSFGLLDYSQLSKLLWGVINLPAWMGRLALIAAISIALAQYLCLLIQATVTYPRTIRQRIYAEKISRLDSLRTEANQLQQDHLRAQNARSSREVQFREADEEHALLAEQALLESDAALGTTPLGATPLTGSGDLAVDVAAMIRKNAETELQVAKANEQQILSTLSASIGAYEIESASVPESRRRYVWSEYAIDAGRIAPPFLFAASALLHLLISN
jgi:hypothetical protein